jgi:hypothetical protein
LPWHILGSMRIRSSIIGFLVLNYSGYIPGGKTMDWVRIRGSL